MPLPPLKCLAIVLCETIHRIHNTTSFDVINTFHVLGANRFPCHFPKITV